MPSSVVIVSPKTRAETITRPPLRAIVSVLRVIDEVRLTCGREGQQGSATLIWD